MKNLVKEERIDAMLNAAERQQAFFFGKQLIIAFRLTNGFIVNGVSVCVDPANFDMEKGVQLAEEDAKRQLWAYEGYLLQQTMHEAQQAADRKKTPLHERFWWYRLYRAIWPELPY